jgi:ribosomal protein L11 methyltransferase
VTAIDTDADAVGSARENAARNGVIIDLRVADVADLSGPDVSATYDVVLANLTAVWLRRLSAPLLSLASQRGSLVLSGIQTSEGASVAGEFSSRRLVRELEEEGWVALVLGPSTSTAHLQIGHLIN